MSGYGRFFQSMNPKGPPPLLVTQGLLQRRGGHLHHAHHQRQQTQRLHYPALLLRQTQEDAHNRGWRGALQCRSGLGGEAGERGAVTAAYARAAEPSAGGIKEGDRDVDANAWNSKS